MPDLDFTSLAAAPAYIGDITLTIKERATPKPMMVAKKDRNGNTVYLDIDGNETIDAEQAEDTVMVPEKDDDGTTDKEIRFDGHIEAAAYSEDGAKIETTSKRFPVGSLPLAMRKDLTAIFAKFRKGYSTGYSGALGTAVRERK